MYDMSDPKVTECLGKRSAKVLCISDYSNKIPGPLAFSSQPNRRRRTALLLKPFTPVGLVLRIYKVSHKPASNYSFLRGSYAR